MMDHFEEVLRTGRVEGQVVGVNGVEMEYRNLYSREVNTELAMTRPRRIELAELKCGRLGRSHILVHEVVGWKDSSSCHPDPIMGQSLHLSTPPFLNLMEKRSPNSYQILYL